MSVGEVEVTSPSGVLGVMITSCRNISDVNSQAAQARLDVLAVDCKDPQFGKDGFTVVQVPSRRVMTRNALFWISSSSNPTASSMTHNSVR